VVGWDLLLNDKPMGWALCRMERQPSGMVEIESYVHFDRLPLAELTPRLFRHLFRDLEEAAGELCMDTQSRLIIDPLGKLLRFDSTLKVDPIQDSIRMRGIVEGMKVQLEVRSNSFCYTSEFCLPRKALLGDALSPQTHLPNLRAGQTWTVPAFSPLRPAKEPMMILHASVEKRELIDWNGIMTEAWLVVYRSDSGYGISEQQTPQSKLWVHVKGKVLKQQVFLFDSVMTFVRLDEDTSNRLAQRVQNRE